MEKRIGVVGIVVESPETTAVKVNQLIGQYRHLIIGRMGIPHHGTDSGVIALIVEGSTDDVGAFTGRLGNLHGVIVKSALTAKKEAPSHD